MSAPPSICCMFELARLLSWLDIARAGDPNTGIVSRKATHKAARIREFCEPEMKVMMQDPVSRPAAKDLQQHEFVQRPHGNAAQALKPLIERSRILAAELFAESDGPPKLPPGVRCMPKPDAEPSS